MKNKHPKREIANKMRTPKERVEGVPVFQTKSWENRKNAIAKRVG